MSTTFVPGFGGMCKCLERECKAQHPFKRVWICECNDPACTDIHIVNEDDEPEQKIEQEPASTTDDPM